MGLRKKQYFCHGFQNNIVMSTVAIDNLALYLIGTMTLAERHYLASKVVTQDETRPYTLDEARERLVVAKEQFRSGQFQSHSEVMQSRKIASV